MLLFSPFEGFGRAFRSDQVGGDVADRLGWLGGSLSESALSTYHHRMGVAMKCREHSGDEGCRGMRGTLTHFELLHHFLQSILAPCYYTYVAGAMLNQPHCQSSTESLRPASDIAELRGSAQVYLRLGIAYLNA